MDSLAPPFAEAWGMAAAVAFRASDEASPITGVVPPVNGGLSL
jgi:NAD(P)-dependent dehydrogenase (short-subunit alcohol dehydrogenase family)